MISYEILRGGNSVNDLMEQQQTVSDDDLDHDSYPRIFNGILPLWIGAVVRMYECGWRSLSVAILRPLQLVQHSVDGKSELLNETSIMSTPQRQPLAEATAGWQRNI